MRREEKKLYWYERCLKKIFVFLIIYLLGILLISGLIIKEIISVESVYAVLPAACFIGGHLSSKTYSTVSKWGDIIEAFINTAIIVVIMIGFGCYFQTGTELSIQNGVLITSLLAGNVVSCLLSAKKKRKGKRVMRKSVS